MSDQWPLSVGDSDPARISTRQEFAAVLTVLREQAGLTVRDVAKAVEVPGSTIGGYFGGRHLPPVTQPGLLPAILGACGVDDQVVVAGWVEALARVRRTPGPRPTGAPAPYRGLARFEADHEAWFFGRERMTDLLLERLRQRQVAGGFLVVVGPSGSGKSSLLRAGMIAALRRGALAAPGSDAWPPVLLTPGAEPLRALAEALAGRGEDTPARVAARLQAEPRRIAEVMAYPLEVGAGQPEGSGSGAGAPRLVLVVDQFEEVFGPDVVDAERWAFIDALWAAASGHDDDRAEPDAGRPGPETSAPALVVLGLRADFYANALRHPRLAEALQHAQVVVTPMTEPQLRSAIVGPARMAGVDIEDGLVELLLNEMVPAPDQDAAGAAHDAGALPLLSHALWSTWERGQRRRLTVADYRDIGGIRGAVARTAEEVYTALSPTHQRLARQLFLRMVQVAEDAPDTRRRVPHDELRLPDSDAQDVLDRFVERRLVTAETGWIEITHEALLVVWPRLRAWIDTDRAGLRVHRQLTAAALTWRESGDDPHALYRGGRLALATEWEADPRHAVDLNPLERQFLDASTDHALAEARAARHRTRSLQQLLAALTALLVAAGLLAGYAFRQGNAADEQRDLAVSRQIAITANQLRASDPALAMQLSLAAYRTATTPEARASLLDSFAGPAVTRALGSPGVVQSVAFTGQGRTMATGGSDDKVRVWRLADGGRPTLVAPVLSGHGDTIYAVAFSPDGRTLASGGGDRTVRLWNVADPGRAASYGTSPMRAEGTVYSVAFSPDGRTLAAGSADGKVRLWGVTNPAHPVELGAALTGPGKAVQSVAFSPDGRMLAAGSADGTVRIWNVADPARSNPVGSPLSGGDRTVFSVSFSPDGRTLAAGSADGAVWLFNLANPDSPTPAGRLTGPASWVNSVAYGPSGHVLAAASSDGKVWIWDLATGSVSTSLPHPGPVTSVAFPRDDSTVATGAADGVARLWQVPGPVLTGMTADVFTASFAAGNHTVAVTSTDNTAALWNVSDPRRPSLIGVPIRDAMRSGRASGAAALSPDAHTLAVGSVTGDIQLWDVSDPAAPVPRAHLPGPTGTIEGIAFSPNGRILTAGSDDKKIWLWDVSDPGQPTRLAEPLTEHTNYAYGPAFSPDGALIAAGGADNTVRLWSVGEPRRPVQLTRPLTEHTNYVFATAFSPDGRILATGGADNTVLLWDVTDARRPRLLGKPLTGPNNYVYSLAFDSSGRTLAAGGGDGRVWLWSLADRRRPRFLAALTGYGGPVYVVAFDPQRGILAAGGKQATVRLWNTDPEEVAAYVCATSGTPITRSEWTKYIPDVPYRAPC